MDYFAKRISIITERLMNKVHQTTLTLCPLQQWAHATGRI